MMIVLIILIIAGTLLSDNDTVVTYTPEQLAHDHDGDGVPDH